jgi:putative ABC transport system ATP-binding protein
MLELKNITKKYSKGENVFTALDDVSLKVEENDFYAVIGPSGSGKSTLLHTAGGLIHPDSGSVFFKGVEMYKAPARDLDGYRKNNVGFVFQQFHLMPFLTVCENISLACHNGKDVKNIDDYLERCSLTTQRNKYPSELSVGEKQRVAFIRAIISHPSLLFADEPTGNLDPANSLIILGLISDFHKKGGTVLLVSHDQAAISYATKTLQLELGRIVAC